MLRVAHTARSGLILLALILVVACGPAPAPTPTAVPAAPSPAPTLPPPPTLPPASPTAAGGAPPPATARQYSLGQAADVILEVAPETTELLELRGTIAVPTAPGTYPVALVLHGSHTVCPLPPGQSEEPERCPQAVQQRNDVGFAALLETLAGAGFIAVAPDLNMAFRVPFNAEGREQPRIELVVERHLARLAAGDPAIGLTGGTTPDLDRTFLIGHSRGGLGAYRLAADWAAAGADPAAGRGAVRGLLLLAPAQPPDGFDTAPPLDVPYGVVLPACDGDVADLEGQYYYEAARFDPGRRSSAVAVFLPGANHNFFNDALTLDDSTRVFARCAAATPRMPRELQRGVLLGLAPALLTAWEAGDTPALLAFDPGSPVPEMLFDAPALLLSMPPVAQRRPILPGLSSDELTRGPLGGAVEAVGGELQFCPYLPVGTLPVCPEVQGVSNPGGPALLHFAWERPGAALRVELPAAAADASAADSLQLRLALNPARMRPGLGPAEDLVVLLRDSAGAEASVSVSLAFPPGEDREGVWSDHVFLGGARLPLAAFAGVDRGRLAAVELRPAGERGALFLADLELVAAAAPIALGPAPSLYRTLRGTAVAPDGGALPEGSQLFLRLFPDPGAGERSLLIIERLEVAGQASPLPFVLAYNQAAIDGRRTYLLESELPGPDGSTLLTQPPPQVITGGVSLEPVALSLAPFTPPPPPTAVPADATLRVILLAPEGALFEPGQLLNLTLARFEAGGAATETVAAIDYSVEGQAVAELVLDLPYPSSAIDPAGAYGVDVAVFRDGLFLVASSGGIVPVDLTAGTVTLQLQPATSTPE